MKWTSVCLIFLAGFLPVAFADEPEFSVSGTESGFWIPETIDFCGDKVPLDRFDAKERMETQLRLYARNLAQIELWVKRKHRYFPVIEAELERRKMPADLKYVSVVESALQTRIISSADAVGPWQFIDSTAQRYGLDITECVDERLDVEKSTRAALEFLSDLHRKFPVWATAVAAYNIGEGRILNECYEQGTQNYYEMILPAETDRYVFKIIAAKLILENPERYGLDLDSLDRFMDPETDKISCTIQNGIPVRILAYCSGMSNREFFLANPWIINPVMKKGQYNFNVMKSRKNDFASELDQYCDLVRNTVDFPKMKSFVTGSNGAAIRLGPHESYPVIRTAESSEKLPFKGHTAFKNNGFHWYLFEVEKNKNGWVWGGDLVFNDK